MQDDAKMPYMQCCDLETTVSRLESTRVHFTKVSVSTAEWQGLIHSRMQQILRKCKDAHFLKLHKLQEKILALQQRLLLLRGFLAIEAFLCTLIVLGLD